MKCRGPDSRQRGLEQVLVKSCEGLGFGLLLNKVSSQHRWDDLEPLLFLTLPLAVGLQVCATTLVLGLNRGSAC